MFRVADWSTRKREIALAFRQATPVPADPDPEVYSSILRQIGVASSQDMSILVSFVYDIIMEARREERPTTPLDLFLDWLKLEQIQEES